jgi:hypothetical protein
MPDVGATRLVIMIMWTVKATDVAAADRPFESHAVPQWCFNAPERPSSISE